MQDNLFLRTTSRRTLRGTCMLRRIWEARESKSSSSKDWVQPLNNIEYDVDRICSEPDDRMTHVPDTDSRPAGIPLPPSSHAKAVNTFGPAKELELELGRVLRGEIRFDAGARAMYASDGSNYRQAPIGVVLPRDNDDVIAAMTACRKFGAPVLSRGAGTSLAGQCCNVAVVFDYTKYMK